MSGARKGSAVGGVLAVLCAAIIVGQLSGIPLRRSVWLIDPPVSLLAAESLIMTGTGMPDVTPEWMALVSDNFIAPTAGAGYAGNPVTTPAQFWPFTGLGSLTLNESTRLGWEILDARMQAAIEANRESGDPIVVFGYSQSAWLAAIEKQVLMSRTAQGEVLPPIDVVMLGNPIRPNGGLFSRFPSLGVVTWTPVISAPTDTTFRSYDIARQYDPLADFPDDPSNMLAVVNAAFGLINHDYSSVTLNPNDPRYDPNTVVQQYGDTTYYLIPSKLPMLEPLRQGGFGQLADTLEPVLTPIVESGYDRTTPYGQPTPASAPAVAGVAAAGAARPEARAARPSRSAPSPAASGSAAPVHRTEKVGRSRR
jgi:hypothetical protein